MVELPHARLAGGPKTMLVLEGLTLENKAPTGGALRLLRWAYKRYLRGYTVYQVARRPGLSAGATTRDMAGDYARWAQGRFDGPVDVIGFSTGWGARRALGLHRDAGCGSCARRDRGAAADQRAHAGDRWDR
jgi:hypothetical protein